MGFGAGEFGSLAWGAGTAVSGQSITFRPTQVPRDGGVQFFITGIPAGSYLVYFGTTGTASDDPVYPGVPGEGTLVTVTGPSQEVELWLPPNPVGTSGLFFDPQSSGTLVNTGPIVAVVPHPFRDKVLHLRSVLPGGASTRWALGYREDTEVERPQQ